MKKKHEHCWHVLSTTSDCLDQSGIDSLLCCHCGQKGLRDWQRVADPAHGTRIPVTLRKDYDVYELPRQ